jgi:hypothetical protein
VVTSKDVYGMGASFGPLLGPQIPKGGKMGGK